MKSLLFVLGLLIIGCTAQTVEEQTTAAPEPQPEQTQELDEQLLESCGEPDENGQCPEGCWNFGSPLGCVPDEPCEGQFCDIQ